MWSKAFKFLALAVFLVLFSETIIIGALFALFRMAFIIGHDATVEFIGGRERR